MVQPQLIDYIKSQIKLGTGEETIKSALLGAGWAEADVNDSMEGAVAGFLGEAKESPEANFPASAVSGAKSNFGAAAAADAGFSRQAPIAVSDLLGGTKLDFVSKISDDKKVIEIKKPEAAKAVIEKEKPKVVRSIGKSAVALAILGVVALAAAGGAVFFYLKNRGLEDKLATLSSESDVASAKVASLNSQVQGLTGSNNDLNSQIASLKNDSQELATNLSFLAVSPDASSTEKMDFTVKGTIGGGGGSPYTLTTARGVKIFVSNYKDEKVDVSLKPLLGQAAEISGNHLPGSRNVTVTAVNGSSAQ